MALSKDNLSSILSEFAQWLEFENVPAIELVVCGGVAMALQDLNVRATRDVDVLGIWRQPDSEICVIAEFPNDVKACILRVAQNHPELEDLGKDWINLGPRDLAKHGLPAGFESRLRTVKFGKSLTLQLLGRADLIPLKLYAASDRFSRRQNIHLDDLRSLKPSFEELEESLKWIATLPDYEEKKPEIQNSLERLGFDDLAQYV